MKTVAEEDWDIMMAKISPNHKYLVYAFNNIGKIEMNVLETKLEITWKSPVFQMGRLVV
ncbi:hypothetical protein [Lentibacillus jeotgali]|uniref:hypothetical protein n=1 Tax=Lentibacillus jeotgali TaxID=558169 RepID=UPI0002DD925D|nr:hypothetical protein [Lentibacillus jeotgali]